MTNNTGIETIKELVEAYNSLQEWLQGGWRLDSTGKAFMVNNEKTNKEL